MTKIIAKNKDVKIIQITSIKGPDTNYPSSSNTWDVQIFGLGDDGRCYEWSSYYEQSDYWVLK